MAELLLTLREREISRTPVTHTRVIIGRDATCDVVIDNAGVSRNHAVVVFVEGEFRVRDTESQNGITVNGKRVAEATLEYGDVIGVGKFELKLCETDDEVELESGTAAKSDAPRSVMATMQMDGAAARMRDEILAKQKAKGAKRSAAGEPKGPANAGGANVSAAAKSRKRSPSPPRKSVHAAKLRSALHRALTLRTSPRSRGLATQSLMRKPAAIAAMVIVPLALIALWMMWG